MRCKLCGKELTSYICSHCGTDNRDTNVTQNSQQARIMNNISNNRDDNKQENVALKSFMNPVSQNNTTYSNFEQKKVSHKNHDDSDLSSRRLFNLNININKRFKVIIVLFALTLLLIIFKNPIISLLKSDKNKSFICTKTENDSTFNAVSDIKQKVSFDDKFRVSTININNTLTFDSNTDYTSALGSIDTYFTYDDPAITTKVNSNDSNLEIKVSIDVDMDKAKSTNVNSEMPTYFTELKKYYEEKGFICK